MLVRKSVPMLAAAATLLASTTPAYAFDSQAPSSGGQPNRRGVQQHPAGSTDWLLIGVDRRRRDHARRGGRGRDATPRRGRHPHASASRGRLVIKPARPDLIGGRSV